MSAYSRVRGREQVRARLIEAWDGTAVSLLGCIILLPGMMITDAAFATPADLSLPIRLGIGLLSWAAMTGLLFAADHLVLRRLRPGWARRISVLALYFLAGYARVLVVASAVPAFGGAPLDTAAVPLRPVSTVVWLSAAAVLVTVLRASERQVTRLHAELSSLEATRRRARTELARTTDQLDRVRALVTGSIDEVRAALHPGLSPAQWEGIADHLADSVDGLVRPTSHRLAADLRREWAGEPSPPRRPTWGQQAAGIVRMWPSAAPFQPVAVAALTVPIAVAAVLARPSMAPAELAQLLVVAVQILIVWLADAVLTPAIAAARPAGQVVIVASGYLALLAVGLAGHAAISGLGVQPCAETTLLAHTAAFCLGGGAALEARLRSAERQAERARDRTRWRVARTQQRLWAERRRLAIALHGQVQATLTACEFLIRRWLSTADPATRTALANQVGDALRSAATIGAPRTGDAVRRRLGEVVDTWSGILEVRLELAGDAERALDADPDGRDAVVEAARELLLNAARHGTAGRVGVAVSMERPQVIALTVVEHGSTERLIEGRKARREGFGLRLLDSISLGWACRATPDGRTTEVRLATA